MKMSDHVCELCTQSGGEILFQNVQLRVVLVDDTQHPGFCRVIWKAHIKEMTDLAPPDRSILMKAVCLVESVIREVMQPEKINLASLGNMVPHLHWHIIPRYADDAQFPAPVWVEAKRVTEPDVITTRRSMLPVLRKAMVQRLNLSA
jgi:diadenosine tetraphosphate (Ap4A) HIT family hydrolase